MSNTENTAKKPATSTLILDYLLAKGRKQRKAGVATTEEIALALDLPVKYVYDRLYWLAKREGRLEMSGKGKAAVWRTPFKARKAKDSDSQEG